MAGRPKIFDEKQAVDQAAQVFWNKCYDAASTDDLLKAIGIGKGSFYLAFKGGKQELYLRSIEQVADTILQNLNNELSRSENEIEFIRQLFLSFAESPDSDKKRGCYLGNALVQVSDRDDQVKQLTVKLLEKLRELFATVIKRAQENGQLETTQDPEILAWHLSNLWNGIQVTRRMEKSPEILRNLILLNLEIIK